MLIGLEVDSVGEIQNVEENNIFDMPKIVINQDTGYYDKVINLNDHIIIMINVSKLLNEEETKVLNDAIQDMR